MVPTFSRFYDKNTMCSFFINEHFLLVQALNWKVGRYDLHMRNVKNDKVSLHSPSITSQEIVYIGDPSAKNLFVHINVESTQSVRPPDGIVIIRIPYIYITPINSIPKQCKQNKRCTYQEHTT